jgi:ferredoxin
MIQCKQCHKEFKSRQGMLSHVRAIHQGIKVGGNPALLSEDQADTIADRAYERAGFKHHHNLKGVVACHSCRDMLIGMLKGYGYEVTEPKSTMAELFDKHKLIVTFKKNPEGKLILTGARQPQE